MNLRFLLCIPVYNNSKTIQQIVAEIGSRGDLQDLPLLIVDDGSEVPVESLIAAQTNLTGRIFILRHSKNEGKGIAIQSAFRWALEHGYTHLLTLDGDGQHAVEDIPKLLTESTKNPWAIIVGDRNMNTPNVPSSSVFGKAFSNFWVRYQTGQSPERSVADSQSGFRVYPLFCVQTLTFFSRRYEFEIEVLTRLIWQGVQVVNVPIGVIYLPTSERVSHFRKGWDNFRISVLNTVLVTVSLLREHTSPFESALAVGVGVFVGCTPLFGLHTGIVILLGLLFRWNIAYLWLGTQISLPPLVPFLIWGSEKIGSQFWGDRLEGPLAGLLHWGTGFGILGIILGTSIGILVYVLKRLKYPLKAPLNAHLISPLKSPPRAKSDDSAVQKIENPKLITQRITQGQKSPLLGVLFLQGVLKTLGLGATYFCLEFIVPYYFIFSSKARRAGREYWKVTHPDFVWYLRIWNHYRLLISFARNLVDRAYQRAHPDAPVFEILLDDETKQNLQKIQSSTGAILVSSHFGGWEIAMQFLGFSGLDKKFTVVKYGMIYGDTSDKQQSLFVTANSPSSNPVHIINYNLNQGSIFQIRENLLRGQVVCLMGDRPASEKIELLPFFGKLAIFDSSPFKIAIAHQTPIFVVLLTKEKVSKSNRSGAYRIRLHQLSLSDDPRATREERLRDCMLNYSKLLEATARAYPHQWYNFFKFWSARPH